MTFANPLPWWVVLALAAAAGFVAWMAYRQAPLRRARRLTLTTIRFVTLATLLVLLMRPVARVPDAIATDAVLPILVDTSRSMGIEDAEGARRIDRARALLTGELLPALSGFRTELFAFGEELQPAGPDGLGASGRRTDLAGALQAVQERYRGRPLAGIVLVSDGGATDSVLELAADGGMPPIFPIGVGSARLAPDREILSLTTADAVLDDSRIELAVSAVGHGYGGEAFELQLLENGRPLQIRRTQPAADGAPVREVFHVTPARGTPTVYSVAIPAPAGELVPENNVRSVLVQPPARPRRVLLIQGAPGFEHTFLRRAWTADQGLDVDSIVRQGRNEQGSDTFYIQAAPARSAALASGFPQSREALFAYDAVVLANAATAALGATAPAALRAFVSDRGGGLLVVGAQSFSRGGVAGTELEHLTPLDVTERGRTGLAAAAAPAANRIALTAAGEAHPMMQLGLNVDETRTRWDALPALAATARLGGPKPGAAVLAVAGGPGGDPRALIAVQRYGEGRTMAFTGEAAWRWRMQLPAADRSYETFWRQAIRWLSLSAADPVALSVPSGAAAGELLTLRGFARTAAFEPIRGGQVDLRVTRPDGRVDAIPAAVDPAAREPGILAGRYRPEEAGVYKVMVEVRHPDGRVESAGTSMLIGGADAEMTDPRLNLPGLDRLASMSGGRRTAPGEAAGLAADLRAALPAAALRAGAQGRDLWHTVPVLLFVVGLLAVEWGVRRRWGLR